MCITRRLPQPSPEDEAREPATWYVSVPPRSASSRYLGEGVRLGKGVRGGDSGAEGGARPGRVLVFVRRGIFISQFVLKFILLRRVLCPIATERS